MSYFYGDIVIVFIFILNYYLYFEYCIDLFKVLYKVYTICLNVYSLKEYYVIIILLKNEWFL